MLYTKIDQDNTGFQAYRSRMNELEAIPRLWHRACRRGQSVWQSFFWNTFLKISCWKTLRDLWRIFWKTCFPLVRKLQKAQTRRRLLVIRKNTWRLPPHMHCLRCLFFLCGGDRPSLSDSSRHLDQHSNHIVDAFLLQRLLAWQSKPAASSSKPRQAYSSRTRSSYSQCLRIDAYARSKMSRIRGCAKTASRRASESAASSPAA